MLNHKLTGDQLEYQKLAEDFAARELAPHAHTYDKSGEFPKAVLEKAFESGLLNVLVPEALGGLGLTVLDAGIIFEELAKGDSGIAGSAEASSFAQQFLIDYGTPEQLKTYLAPMLDKPTLAGYGALGSIKGDRVFFRKEGDEFVLSGRHASVINGGVADWFIIRAQEDRREVGGNSANTDYSYFIVHAEDDGLNFSDRNPMLGRRAMVIGSARFESILLEADRLVGQVGDGAAIYNRCLTKNFPLMAAGMVGVAGSALSHAVRYAKERTTFGVNIGHHQSIAFMLADMAKEIEAARLLVRQAAQLADAGVESTTEAICAKAYAQDMVMRTTCDAVQIFGGYGFSREYPVEKLMRDAKTYQLMESTSESLKAKLGRELVMSV